MDAPSAEPALPRMTVEEYFAFEESSQEKHEFRDGEVVAMSGASPRHERIVSRLLRALGNRLDGTPCEPYSSNLRIAVDAANRYFYPDVSVICGPLQFGPHDRNGLAPTNPRVLFEVTSPSTQHYDHTEKFKHFLKLGSLEEYVLLHQERAEVQGLLRQPDGTWNLAVYDGLDATMRVRSLGLEIPLAEIYPPEE